MKLQITQLHWERIRKQIPLKRLKNTMSPKNRVTLQNYVLQLDQPKHYPRVHIIAFRRFHRDTNVNLEIHVDREKHKGADYYHPKIESITNLIKNS